MILPAIGVSCMNYSVCCPHKKFDQHRENKMEKNIVDSLRFTFVRKISLRWFLKKIIIIESPLSDEAMKKSAFYKHTNLLNRFIKLKNRVTLISSPNGKWNCKHYQDECSIFF